MPNSSLRGAWALSARAGSPKQWSPARPRAVRKVRRVLMISGNRRRRRLGVSAGIRLGIGQFPGQHDPGAEDGASREPQDTGGQWVGALALVREIGRRVAVERGGIVDLDLVGDGQLEKDIRFGA